MSADVVAADPLNETFLAAPTVVGQVRMLLEFRLTEWGLLGRASDVYLVAGELVTNAVESTPEERIAVCFARLRGGVRLGVWDCSNALPVVKPVISLSLEDITPDAKALDPGHDDATGGWGLPIVEALSERCGVQKTPPRGKWVWSLIAC